MTSSKCSAREALVSLWTNIDRLINICMTCGLTISSCEILARTYCLQSQVVEDEERCRFANSIDLPNSKDKLLIFQRHLACLEESTAFVAISHVWFKEVAAAQTLHDSSSIDMNLVAGMIFSTAANICQGIAASMSTRFEIWYDYMSVPQWQISIKSLIIPSIPRIFKRAAFVLVHIADLDSKTVVEMRTGRTTYARCRAISKICSIKWFSRVWTAMEYTQPSRFRFMAKNYRCIDEDVLEDRTCGNLFAELHRRWRSEVAIAGSVHKLEAMVGIGQNLVPWQLGPLEAVRMLMTAGMSCTFALAHQVFARRCITNPRDFFGVMLSLLSLPMTEKSLSRNSSEALLQIAQACLEKGDISPLFIVPASLHGPQSAESLQANGYNALNIFGLGVQQRDAPHRTVQQRDGRLHLAAECLGDAQAINNRNLAQSPEEEFAVLVKLAIETNGDSLDDFLHTLGTRLYGQSVDSIYQCLAKHDKLALLQEHLTALRDSVINDQQPQAEHLTWIADALGLSNRLLATRWTALSPMQYMRGHGDSIHLMQHGAIMIIRCRSCCRDFLLRAALFLPIAADTKLTAWRVPNLKFTHSLAGGTGLILDGSKIAGRFMWSPRTCDCWKSGETEIVLNEVPAPLPNRHEYGASGSAVQHAVHPLMFTGGAFGAAMDVPLSRLGDVVCS